MVFCKHSKKTAQTSREAVRVIHKNLYSKYKNHKYKLKVFDELEGLP